MFSTIILGQNGNTDAATDVRSTTATLNGHENAGTGPVFSFTFYYDTETNFIASGDLLQSISGVPSSYTGSAYQAIYADLTSLTPGITYKFSLHAGDAGGFEGDTLEFSTPKITVGSISGGDDFGFVPINSTSSPKSFTVEGVYLQGNITVDPPSGFKISETESGYSSDPITLTESSGTVTQTTIYVVFTPTEVTSYSDAAAIELGETVRDGETYLLTGNQVSG